MIVLIVTGASPPAAVRRIDVLRHLRVTERGAIRHGSAAAKCSLKCRAAEGSRCCRVLTGQKRRDGSPVSRFVTLALTPSVSSVRGSLPWLSIGDCVTHEDVMWDSNVSLLQIGRF